MDYNIHGIKITQDDVNNYINKLINNVFAILPIYEDCVENDNLKTFNIYLNRLCVELSGAYKILGSNNYLTIVNILSGINVTCALNHDNIKSLTFYCISLLKNIKVE